jgi:hypothetical protein
MIHQSPNPQPCNYAVPKKEFFISHAEHQNADNIETVSKEQICVQLKWDYLRV